MSRPNYKLMDNFPLFATDCVSFYCPSCGELAEKGMDECPVCGSELHCEFDEVLAHETISDVQKRLDDVNRNLTFHTIEVDGGEYYGIQLYVREDHNPNEYDNEECRYNFDMFRSVAIRRFNSEINKITKLLGRLADEFGFDELYCTAVFGNGEAHYAKAQRTQRSRVMQAVSPRI